MPRHHSPSSSQTPYAAFCEEFDEDAEIAIPETRTVANVAAKRSKPDLRSPSDSFVIASPLDGASDSGYSSRTAATVGSGDSVPSTRSDPTVTERDIERARRHRDKHRQQQQYHQQQQLHQRQQLHQQQQQQQQREREREQPQYPAEGERDRRRDRERERQGRPSPEAVMSGSSAHRTSSRSGQDPRSRSKSTRRQSVTAASRHPPGVCWECDQQAGFSHTPVDSRSSDYPPYVHQKQPTRYDMHPPPSPSMSSSSSRYPPSYSQEIHSSAASRRTSTHRQQSPHRSLLYHESNPRPVSYHGGMGPPDMTSSVQIPSGHHHPLSQQQQYDHGPPLSASAYARSFNQSPFPQQSSAYGPPPIPPPQHQQQHQPPPPPQSPRFERARAPSHSRPAEQRPRRSSIYGPPVVQYSAATPTYQDVSSPERKSSREYNYSGSQQYYNREEDFYLMPPPPPPKSKSPPKQVIAAVPRRPSVRKSATTSNTPTVQRPQYPLDMSDLRAQLPDPRVRRRESRESPILIPERRPSVSGRPLRTSSYHDSSRAPAPRILKDDERRRRTSVYGVERPRDLEQKQREAEEYQASRASRATPLTADALARRSHRPDSDSASSNSRSDDSSRASETKTKSGSGVGSRHHDDDDSSSITMTIQGVRIGFSGDNRERKKINVRSGEEGALEFNIEGGRRSKKYLMSRSDSASGTGRKEIEDVRRVRDDWKSDRASRRASRSGYNGRGLLE